MSWTTTDLATLEAAIAQGVLRVKYTDKEITYRSLAEMLQLRDLMRRSLGLTGQFNRIKTTFSRATDDDDGSVDEDA